MYWRMKRRGMGRVVSLAPGESIHALPKRHTCAERGLTHWTVAERIERAVKRLDAYPSDVAQVFRKALRNDLVSVYGFRLNPYVPRSDFDVLALQMGALKKFEQGLDENPPERFAPRKHWAQR